MVDLCAIALALPDVTQGIACAGTALESRTYQVKGKAFLFEAPKDLRLKLASSAADAAKLGFSVGSNGWVKVPLDALPAAPVLRRWIGESHALMAAPASKGAAKKAAPARRKAR